MLYRKKAPRYELHLQSSSARAYWNPTLVLKGRPSAKWPPKIFEVHRELSRLMRPLFATVLPHFKAAPGVWEDRAACNITTWHDLLVFGLPRLGLRTWLGPHAVEQVGLNLLRNAPGVVLREHDPGSVEVDLGKEPWTLDGPDRIKRAREVSAYLAESGAFGDYAFHFREDRPANPSWNPPPDTLEASIETSSSGHVEAPHTEMPKTIALVLSENSLQSEQKDIPYPDPIRLTLPNGALHLLQRVFVLDRYQESVTPAGSSPTTRDYDLIQDAAYDLDSHLLCRSDRQGLYMPIGFQDPIFDERLPGGILGSVMGLRAELSIIAPYIGIEPCRNDAEDQPEDHPFAREQQAWSMIDEAIRRSLESGAVLILELSTHHEHS
jgi:hypothetical protein